MREKINRLAKGIIDTDQIELILDPQTVETEVQTGRSFTGELNIQEMNGGFVKGLVYSTNIRVKVVNDAFGGIRSRIVYEVDASHLDAGDTITGAFQLVTNGGEAEIPYTFTVVRGQSGMILDSLKTASDFARIARQDPETALRLMSYEDFVEAPFMRNPHIRTLYDGLKGSPDRRICMEEFLVALGLKQPVELHTDQTFRHFLAPEQTGRDEITVKMNTWGQVQFQVTADGDFLSLPKTTYSAQDFMNGECKVTYLVDPAHLHAGHNLGAVHISTIREQLTVRVEVQGPEQDKRFHTREVHENLSRYIGLRIEYEMESVGNALILGQLDQELQRLRSRYGDSLLFAILEAELCILRGDHERAARLLNERRGEMAEHRQERYIEYCFYIYLQLQLQPRDGQKETLIRLVKKYLDEEAPSGVLFYLWTKLNPSLYELPRELLIEAQHLFARGCHSPMLYAVVLKLWQAHPEFLQVVDDYALQILLFGVRRKLMTPEFAEYAARLAAERKYYHKLTCHLLILICQQFQTPACLEAVCAMLMKGDFREPEYFHWYEEALKKGICLTRLYEYYLYALPQDYEFLLPKEVLMYFSYEKGLDDHNRSKLYMNIVKYMKEDSPLYKQYERDIEQFTMQQLLKSRINRRLIVLYQHMLYPEMIDQNVARVLPSVLRSYRIRVKNPNIRYVIVRYEELEEEDAYLIQDGVAYVPLFLERAVMLFQDAYGNRYSDVSCRKVPAMDKMDTEKLLERCYEVFPNHPMLRLQESGEVLEKGIHDDSDVMVLRKIAADLPLTAMYRRRILSDMVRYHTALLRRSDQPRRADAGYLLSIDPKRLTKEERSSVFETLAGQKYYTEIWDRICEYGSEGLSDTCLQNLCSWRILKELSGEDERMLSIICGLFERGRCDSVLLDYLCEHYNGASSMMYRILSRGKQDHLEVYDLPERLLAQQLFTGETKYLDQVFEWYASGKMRGESLMKAYFTKKSADYFLKESETGDKVFAYLEGAVQNAADLHRIPTIYLLALCRYYSDCKGLDEERKTLCARMIEVLLEEERVFSWYKKLGAFVALPESVMDKTILEYRSGHGGPSAGKPQMMIRILPDEEEFHPEAMKRVYADIYVSQKVLFAGETMEYQIYENENGEDVLKTYGSISPQNESAAGGSRYAALNEMCLSFENRQEDTLKEKMKKYLTDDETVGSLFPLQ